MDKILGIDKGLNTLLQKAPGAVLDYGFIMDCLQEYSNPKVKLHHLLKIGALIRLKKGLYLFGEKFAKGPYSVEVVANLLYGPSYVSLEWACQYYRLIPERVTTVTSVTTQRTREFTTPIGLFTYTHLPLEAFPVGITMIQLAENSHALFATKEKALADLLMLRRGRFRSMKHLKETLFEDLRIEEEDIHNLDCELLKTIAQSRPHSALHFLLQYLESL